MAITRYAGDRFYGLDSEKIDLAKHKSHEAASELCYEKEKYVLENLIFQLTLQKSRGVM